MTDVAGSVSLADRITQLVDSGDFQLPPLPDLVVRLQEELSGEDANVGKVTEWIRTEPAISASLLRSANSAMYGGLRPISDLRQAIARLGLGRVKNLVTTLTVQGQFHSEDPHNRRQLQMLWDHAVASAAAGRTLALREGADAEEAFMAGLLHGIGRLMVLKAIDQLRRDHPGLQITGTVAEELVETMQFDLGYRTLKSWNLSDDICNAARAMDPAMESETNLLLTITQAADLLAMKVGAHPKPDPELNLADQEPIERLELRNIELASLMVDLEDAIEAIHDSL